MLNFRIGLQSWTVRDEFKKDYRGTLKRLSDIGYTSLEIGGYGPYSTKQWNRILADLGMKIISIHMVDGDALSETLNHTMEFCEMMGINYIGYPCPRHVFDNSGKFDSNNEDHFRRESELINDIGRRCRDNGIRLVYHNHSFEFNKFGDKYGLDIIAENTNPEFVQFEIDTYWTRNAGVDPVSILKRFAGRCDIIHLKDMKDDPEKSFAEIGEGIIDFKEVLKTAGEIGVRYLMVEQDVCKRPSMESVKLSYGNILKLLSGM